jgi:hypothetical protein
MARVSKTFQKPINQFLVKLPGEIRNKIYELCILSALKETNKSRPIFNSHTTIVPAGPLSGLQYVALPRWSGPGLLRLEGIGALPCLFTNKQIYREISSLLHSMVQNVSIGGYVLQCPGEDPSVRWECAYSLMRNRADILQFVKRVTVMLPCIREGVFRGRWSEFSLKDPGTRVESEPWLMLPGLTAFLRTFKSLQTLKIVMTADKSNPPDFEQLLPLYDVRSPSQ